MRDGEAVAAVRGQLERDGVSTRVPWRSTVVREGDGEWVVRTWTATPAAERRPTGPPQFVHRVRRTEAAGPELERVG